MATKEEMKKEIIEMINSIENPYWISMIYNYLLVIKEKESI